MTRRALPMVIFCLVSCIDALPQPANESKPSEVWQGVTSSFSFPIRQWFREGHGSKENLAKELSFGVAFNQPLLPAQKQMGTGSGSQGDRGTNSSNFSFSIRDTPITSWFVQASVYAYVNPKLKRPWNPDFTYSFGYDDWHPYTFSLTYANYGGNRFQPGRKEAVTIFSQGGINFGWKFNLPKKAEAPFLVHRSSTLNFSVNHLAVPRYTDLATNSTKDWKHSEQFSCKNNVYGNFYWNLTLFYYPIGRQRQPWDPDFTYGFGYFDWRPGKISVEYNNYAGNRYPWNKAGPTAGKFRSGAVSIMWNVK